MAAAEREGLITVRVSKDERGKVNELAEADGISVSDVVRMLVRREHAARFGAKATKRRRR